MTVSARFYLAETLVAQLVGARSLSRRLPASCGPLAVQPSGLAVGAKTWKKQDRQVNTVKLETWTSERVFWGMVSENLGTWLGGPKRAVQPPCTSLLKT